MWSFFPWRRKSSRVIIRDAVEVRLRMLIPYIEQWPQVGISLNDIMGIGYQSFSFLQVTWNITFTWFTWLCFHLQAMGLMLLPYNAPDAAKNVAYLVDEIWYHAGDTSTDVRTWKCNKAKNDQNFFVSFFLYIQIFAL